MTRSRRGKGAVMPQQRGPGLSLAEWLVLCLASERPVHGFAIAGLLAEGGSLGRIWHVRKAVVYRAAQRRSQLAPIADALAGQTPATTGFDQVLLQWRYESVSATLRFLDARLATVPAPRAG